MPETGRHKGRPTDPSMCQTDYTGVDYSLLPHIFTVIWEEDRIEWYVCKCRHN